MKLKSNLFNYLSLKRNNIYNQIYDKLKHGDDREPREKDDYRSRIKKQEEEQV